jgi:hypothetical protein
MNNSIYLPQTMSGLIRVTFFLILSSVIFSCNWIYRPGACDASGPVVVYKTKQDYSNNLTIQLSKDGKKVTAYPGKQDAIRQRPIELVNGYLLKRMVGDAVVSLTIDEYALSSFNYSPADL